MIALVPIRGLVCRVSWPLEQKSRTRLRRHNFICKQMPKAYSTTTEKDRLDRASIANLPQASLQPSLARGMTLKKLGNACGG
jgi:hypothetical protein